MLDFKKIGEAALYAVAHDEHLHKDEHAEAIGRAAVAAMIPAPEDGECNHCCPFWMEIDGSMEDLTTPDHPGCRLHLEEASDKEPEEEPGYDYLIKPGPSCPATKEASHAE